MGVQEKNCTRGGEGSIADGRDLGGMLVEVLDDEARRVRVVCRGRVGSQDSICNRRQQDKEEALQLQLLTQSGEGLNPLIGDMMVAGWLLKLVELP